MEYTIDKKMFSGLLGSIPDSIYDKKIKLYLVNKRFSSITDAAEIHTES